MDILFRLLSSYPDVILRLKLMMSFLPGQGKQLNYTLMKRSDSNLLTGSLVCSKSQSDCTCFLKITITTIEKKYPQKQSLCGYFYYKSQYYFTGAGLSSIIFSASRP